MATSPPHRERQSHQETESLLSSLVYEMSQQVHSAMENMLKMINEIDQNSSDITENIAKCRDSALERKQGLEEQKEQFQKAAYTVIDMLNNRNQEIYETLAFILVGHKKCLSSW